MKKMIKISSLLFLVLFISSCRKDVPSGKRSYVGTWTSTDETIIIDANGGGAYENSGGYSLTGRTKFKSPGFEIKALFITKKFSVDQEPTIYTSFGASNYYAKFNGTIFHRN